MLILLIAVSGFIIGDGPEGMHGDLQALLGWGAMLSACIAAPIAGFVCRAKGKSSLGLLIAALPILGALLVAAGVIRPS